MFCPSTLYKQLIILHYSIDLVKRESTYEPDLFFFKSSFRPLQNICKVMASFSLMAHLIMESLNYIIYSLIDMFPVLDCFIGLRVYSYKIGVYTFPVVFVSSWSNQL
jgi:hypothetical protein